MDVPVPDQSIDVADIDGMGESGKMFSVLSHL